MHYKRCQNADIRYTIHPIQLSCQIHLTVHIPEWSCKSETVESPADIVALLWHQIVQHLSLRLHLMILESVLNKWLKLTVMIFASCSSWDIIQWTHCFKHSFKMGFANFTRKSIGTKRHSSEYKRKITLHKSTNTTQVEEWYCLFRLVLPSTYFGSKFSLA